ncbi:MAG: hypothetical protein RL488_1205 [Actinomycetota bacterium]|jgi:hypothetical protein
MNFADINWAAFAVVYVIGFVVSSIWFGPKTFYPIWWKLMGDRPMPTRDNQQGSPLAMFGLTMLGLFVQVAAVALLVQVLELPGALTGLFVGLVAAFASLGHRMFAGHGVKVWAIEVTPDVIVAVIAGIILSLWR